MTISERLKALEEHHEVAGGVWTCEELASIRAAVGLLEAENAMLREENEMMKRGWQGLFDAKESRP